MGRIHALILLTWALLRVVVKRLFGRHRQGIERFRENYDADYLPPVDAEERRALPSFGRCICCGICDRGEAERIARSGGAYRGVMALMVAASRSMPDYRAAAYSFSFVPDGVLAEKEPRCPARVPMRQIAQFVVDKAGQVGGPLPLPSMVPSLQAPARSSSAPGVSPPLLAPIEVDPEHSGRRVRGGRSSSGGPPDPAR